MCACNNGLCACNNGPHLLIALHDILDAQARSLQDVTLRADDGVSQVAQLVVH